MKALCLTLLACVLFLTAGCEKENIDALPAPELYGTWEMSATSSGWGGSQEYEPGNGNSITFTSGRYERISNGEKQSGKYKLKADTSKLTNQPTTYIIFYDENDRVKDTPSGRTFVRVEGDTLVIGTDVVDGSASYYTKLTTAASGG